MKKILVTSDFSTNSKAGIRLALQVQAQSGCELVFYHVIEIMKPTSWNDKRYKEFAKTKIIENVKKLETFVSEVCLQTDHVAGNFHYIAEIGTSVDEMIVKYAKKTKADFICIATRGAGKFEKLFGTNTSELITTSAIPILVAPKNYRQKPLTSLFYASDFSALGKELKTLDAFAQALRLKVQVFHFDYLLHVEENKKKLEKKALKYATPTITFHFKRQEIETPLSVHLKKEIEKEKSSITVLFTKQNRNWFDRLFLASEAADMSFSTKAPLLIYRKK